VRKTLRTLDFPGDVCFHGESSSHCTVRHPKGDDSNIASTTLLSKVEAVGAKKNLCPYGKAHPNSQAKELL
jgi:hypothetical protein